MSMDSLKADLKANLAELSSMDPMVTTTSDLIKHLKGTLWPFIESFTDEAYDIDSCVGDILEGAEDILQPETAATFAAITAGGLTIAAALKARITRETEPQLWKVIAEFEKNCKTGEEILKEIVVDTGDDGDDEVDEDDDVVDDEADDNTEGATP